MIRTGNAGLGRLRMFEYRNAFALQFALLAAVIFILFLLAP